MEVEGESGGREPLKRGREGGEKGENGEGGCGGKTPPNRAVAAADAMSGSFWLL